MRAFIAIDLPENIRESLHLLQKKLHDPASPVSWVNASSLHITLKFLGEITQEQAQAVKQMLQSQIFSQAPFTIKLGGLGAFPSLRAPAVLWVGVSQGDEAVKSLAGIIEKESRRLSLRGEERPFSAHVTIGRLRGQAPSVFLGKLREVKWREPGAWQAEALTFYQSVLSPEGPRYSVLAEVAFSAGKS